MFKLSVCVETFWRDRPFEERIHLTAGLGYQAFEFWGWKGKNLEAIEKAAAKTGLQVAAISLEPSFVLIYRHKLSELRQGLKESLAVAKRLRCPTMIVTTGNTLDDESFEATRRRAARHLRAMAPLAEEAGVTLVIEPLNVLVDHHGYWLTRMSEAVDIVEEVNSPAVKILMDLYHQQITEGNLIANIRQYIQHIGHFHAAGVPGRRELVGGEQDYRAILKAIAETGYNKYFGLEYMPTRPEEEGLREALALMPK